MIYNLHLLKGVGWETVPATLEIEDGRLVLTIDPDGEPVVKEGRAAVDEMFAAVDSREAREAMSQVRRFYAS
jgi:hypothetical protein